MVSVHHDRKTVTSTESALAGFTRRVDALGVRYAVLRLRGLESGAEEAEADILVAPEDLEAVRRSAREAGFQAVYAVPGRVPTADRDRRVHLRYEAVTDRVFILEFATDLWFDPKGGHHHPWRIPGLANRVLNATQPGDHGREAHGPCGPLAAVLHESINRFGRRERRLQAALTALAAADPDGSLAVAWLGSTAGRALRDAMSATLAGRPAPADPLRQTLIRAVRRAAWREPGARVARWAATWVDRLWHRRLGRRRSVVSVIGPDGVGKTTACLLLQDGLQPPRGSIRYQYAGRTKRTGLARAPRLAVKAVVFAAERVRTGVRDRELLHLVEVRLRLWGIRIRALIGALRGPALYTLEVRDRGLSDELAALTNPVLIERARRFMAAGRRERLVILLSDDPASIVARKDELTEEEIAATFDRYRRTLPRYADLTPWVEIPIGSMDAETVARACRRVLFEQLDDLVAGP